MSGRLQGRIALVTGAGSGIGAATAAWLKADGAKVYGVDREGAVGADGGIIVCTSTHAIPADCMRHRSGRIQLLKDE